MIAVMMDTDNDYDEIPCILYMRVTIIRISLNAGMIKSNADNYIKMSG